MNFYYSLIPETSRGQEFLRKKNKDDLAKNLEFPEGARRAAENFEKLLSSPQMKPIEEEFRICKKKRNGQPTWHQLFGGPSTIQALADHLRRPAQYDILYRQWSGISHAHDISRFIGSSSTGEWAIFGLRNPRLLKDVCSFSSSILLSATRKVLEKYRPEENIGDWFRQEVQERYLFVTRRNP